MRTSRIVAAIVAIGFVAVALTHLYAQTQPPISTQAPPRAATAPVGNHGMAVIDVTFILEHYSRLKLAMEAYKRDAQTAEDVLKKERDGLAKRAERLKTLKPGSPDFKAEEEGITKAESDWKLKVAAQRRDFAERESKNYLRAYQELSAAVKAYAERNGISLVLRFNGAPIDPNNREMVQMEVFKMVMYYDKSVDITDPILAELNRSAAIAAPPTARPRR
ncbi:MAG: OmpH family outer membrane protein [Pirellulales bacterium]